MKEIPADERRMAYALARRGDVRPVKLTNEQFAALPPEQQRVAIAHDVLDWMAIKRIVPEPGTYLRLRNDVGDIVRTEGKATVNGYTCTVCALGAVYAAATDLGVCPLDTADLRSESWPTAARTLLADYFPREQLLAIESAFECADFSEREEETPICRAGADFGRRVVEANPASPARAPKVYADNPSRLMRAIMQNIIDNEGTFIP